MFILIGSVVVIASVLGGFVAGRLAKALEIKHGAAVGVGSMIVSTLEQALAENSTPLPEWFVLISYLAAIPAGALGGYLAERWREFGVSDRPPGGLSGGGRTT